MFLVQAFFKKILNVLKFIAAVEVMEKLLIKRLFGEDCPREAYMKEIKA